MRASYVASMLMQRASVPPLKKSDTCDRLCKCLWAHLPLTLWLLVHYEGTIPSRADARTAQSRGMIDKGSLRLFPQSIQCAQDAGGNP